MKYKIGDKIMFKDGTSQWYATGLWNTQDIEKYLTITESYISPIDGNEVYKVKGFNVGWRGFVENTEKYMIRIKKPKKFKLHERRTV